MAVTVSQIMELIDQLVAGLSLDDAELELSQLKDYVDDLLDNLAKQ